MIDVLNGYTYGYHKIYIDILCGYLFLWISYLDILFRIWPEFISNFAQDILKNPFKSYISVYILFISFDIFGGKLPDVRTPDKWTRARMNARA